MKLEFPGFDQFEPTAPLMHAIFTLRDLIPAGCESIRVEFIDQGSSGFATADGHDVELDEKGLGLAGFLLSYISHQLIQLTEMLDGQEIDTRTAAEIDEDIEAARQRLLASLGQSGLSIGYLEPLVGEGDNADYADSITVFAASR